MKNEGKTSKHLQSQSSSKLTLGEIVMATFDTYGEKLAPKIIQYGLDSRLICFK